MPSKIYLTKYDKLDRRMAFLLRLKAFGGRRSPDTLGELTVLPRLSAGIEGAASRQGTRGKARAGKKRGGEWEQREERREGKWTGEEKWRRSSPPFLLPRPFREER